MSDYAQMSEYAQRTLSVLEEFSHDNVFAILNTIERPTGTSDEVEKLRVALEILIGAGHVNLMLDGVESNTAQQHLPRETAIEIVRKMADWFAFDNNSGFWTIAEGDMRIVQVPSIYVTSAGLTEARQILGARGYRWWVEKICK